MSPSRVPPSRRGAQGVLGNMAGMIRRQAPGGSGSSSLTSPVGYGRASAVDMEPLTHLAQFSNTGTLTVTTGTHRMYAEHGGIVRRARASVGTVPTGTAAIIQIRLNGTAQFTMTIAAGTYTKTANPALVIAAGDYITVDVTQIGSTVAGANLTVTLDLPA